MYTLDERNVRYRKRIMKNVMIYAILTMFFALFGAIYELFSHEVYSYFMIYAFAVPLVMGVIPFAALAIKDARLPSRPVTQLYGGGVVMLTLGCTFKGVLDIYGTTNAKIALFFVLGGAMVLTSAAFLIVSFKNKKV